MRPGVHRTALGHHVDVRSLDRDRQPRPSGDPDADPRDPHPDLSVHDAPISAFTMLRSWRSRSRGIRISGRLVAYEALGVPLVPVPLDVQARASVLRDALELVAGSDTAPLPFVELVADLHKATEKLLASLAATRGVTL